MLLCQTLGKCFTLHIPSSLSSVYEYLVIDSGGYLCMNNLHILIVVWLNASQRSPDGVQLNMLGSNG